MKKLISFNDINFTGSPVMRAELNNDVAMDYAEAYLRKESIPIPVIYLTKEHGLVVADGRHRLHALRINKVKATVCDVREGTIADAFRAGVQLNDRNGLRRTNADKRQCVMTALSLYTEQSNEKIAELAAVGHSLVAEVRKTLEQNGTIQHTDKRTGKDGKARAVPATNTSRDTDIRMEAADKEKPKEAAAKPAVKDGTGYPIPDPALPVWERRFEAIGMVELVQELRRDLKLAVKENDPLFLECNLNALDLELDKVEARLKLAVPYAVCPTCQGKLVAKCSKDGGCGGRGMVSKHKYETGFSKELKQAREKGIK